jgi:glyoxylase-like metal-dependent hydrolase (beta-lactamase superfamily II)
MARRSGDTAMPQLRAALVASLIALVLFVAAPAPAAGLFDIEWTELSPGIHVGQRPDPMRYPVVCNTVVVIGDDGVLVFDAGGFPAQGEQVLAKIKSLTPKPVKYVVISHWHGDHNRGIAPILDAFPRAQIVGHTFTRDAMLGAPMQRIFKSEKEGGVRDTAAEVKKALDEGKFFDGTPLDPAEKPFFERFGIDAVEHQTEVMRMRITPPTLTFDDKLEIKLGKRLIQLRHFGPGNTKGDAVMILPGEGIIAAGDLVVAPIPYAFGSYPASWVNVLKELKATRYKTLVPGHGPLQTDTAYIDLLGEALSLVATQVNAAVAQGKPAREIFKSVDISRVEPRFTKGDPILKRFFSFYFRDPAIESAMNVAKGIESEKLTEDPPAKTP